MNLPKDVAALAGIFAVSGVIHLVRPEVYEPLMPSWVPRHREVILGSGVAELACAAGLALPATRRTAGWASAALLIGVFPGNLKMASDAQQITSTKSKVKRYQAVTLVRLPLQLPMIRAALRAARG
ncbi:MAG: DoxX family protein [Marmoricola sp.]